MKENYFYPDFLGISDFPLAFFCFSVRLFCCFLSDLGIKFGKPDISFCTRIFAYHQPLGRSCVFLGDKFLKLMETLLEKLSGWFKGLSLVPSWLKESNRDKHFLVAIPCGIIGGFLFVLGLALGMEFKDRQYGGKFDILDITATILGGLPGSILHVILGMLFLF